MERFDIQSFSTPVQDDCFCHFPVVFLTQSLHIGMRLCPMMFIRRVNVVYRLFGFDLREKQRLTI
ncbi:hypothetical protein HALLA_05940 [Halostagnicola larsenii XH-48]|uniref:Uncharacterized protein n=1 Tax=Halostagnicola larsenii XH-48 TaxID=797299 RepID=W0JU20_9EURY|nr:hypothetical protein HALLA_05940 [Halostagnicola larsenii XH-48]